MKQRRPNPSPSMPKHQDGFLLLGVLVMLVLILLALAVAAPKIAESIRRDKEIETVHRGMQYARAIQVYYNKFGRYPTTIDQLVKTDNQRFLRKRYLNPMTGKDDWRIIHYGEQRVPTMGLFGQAVQQQAGMTPGVNNAGVASNGAGSSSPFGSSGAGFGGNNSSINSSASGSSSGGFPAFGTTPQTLSFSGDSTTDTANNGSSPQTTGSSTSGGIGSSSGIGSTDSSTNGGTGSGFGSSGGIGGTTTAAGGAFGSTPIGGTQTTGGSNSAFGTPGVSVGAPIIGVGLLSKKTSIKIYKKQTHYNQWEFIYDPNQNVAIAAGGVGGATNGIGTNGGSASSFGSGSGNGFGSSNGPGFGSSNGPGSGSSNGPGFGSSSGPGFGSSNGSTFGSSPTSPSPSSPTNNTPQ
jgi:type II secretory pathway pseudopilin PulG